MAVAYPTVTVELQVRDKFTVNVTVFVPELPSATDTLTGLIETTGAATSSLVIVTVDVAVPTVAPDGADRVTVNVSSVSAATSPSTVTVMSWVVWPALKITVPETAV